jgi:site-specific recombinase XerD
MKYSDAVDDFLRVKRREGLSQSTIDGYRRTLASFGKSVPGDLFPPTRQDYERFIDGYYDRGVSKATIAHHWRNLKVFSRWATEEGLCEDTFAKIKAPKVDVRLHANLLSLKDFEALVAACPPKTLLGRRDRAILHVLYETGVRVGELCAMKDEDVDLDLGRAKVWGKGSKERFVFFGDRTALAMTRYRMMLRRIKEPTLFFVTQDMAPMNEQMVRLMLIRRAKAAGVTADVNPHAFRHAFATNYLRAGGDLNSLQRILGHASLAIVTRYLSLATDDLAVKHRQFSPLSR